MGATLMAGPRKDDVEKMQQAYVGEIVKGATKEKAKEVAGYSQKTHPYQIETPKVVSKIVEELKRQGITEERLAQEYREGIEASKKPGAREADHNAHAKYLLQLGYLLGYGKKDAPSVAVQINNNQPGVPDAGSGADVIARLEAIVGILEEKAGVGDFS